MSEKKGFKVFRSTAGLGLKTTRDIEKGDEVIEYTGERITSEEANKRGGRYLFELDDKETIDGSGRNNLARYINHSCRPNCEAVHYEKEDQVCIEAIKNIKAGDELTYNYGKTYYNEYIKPHGCLCQHCLTKRAKQKK